MIIVVSRALQLLVSILLTKTRSCTYARNTDAHRDSMMMNVCNFVREASGSITKASSFAAGAAITVSSSLDL